MLPVSLTLHASPSQSPDSQYDSYLTIGIDGPAQTPGALSSIGLDFDAWTETEGIDTNNGAVFFMDPEHGAEVEPVVFAQLTVATGTSFFGTINAQGRNWAGENVPMSARNWETTGLTFLHQPHSMIMPGKRQRRCCCFLFS